LPSTVLSPKTTKVSQLWTSAMFIVSLFFFSEINRLTSLEQPATIQTTTWLASCNTPVVPNAAVKITDYRCESLCYGCSVFAEHQLPNNLRQLSPVRKE
jgi:hypothetical protein